jgi:hypothetical protein
MSFYKEEIEPIVSSLCRLDEGKSESNFGEMKEIVKGLALLIKEDETILEKLKEYSKRV